MSLLSTYKNLLTEKLGTSGSSFYTSQMRIDAINEAITDIYNAYDIPDLFKVSTLSLTSGVAAIPSDMFRMIKMWDVTTTSLEYIYIDANGFDELATTASSWWTIDYNVAAAARRILVKPTSITSVNIRYVRTPTTLAADSDNSLLPATWDDAVAYRAASILANNGGDYNRVKGMQSQADQAMARAYGAVKNIGGVRQGSRLRSRFERINPITNNGQIP